MISEFLNYLIAYFIIFLLVIIFINYVLIVYTDSFYSQLEKEKKNEFHLMMDSIYYSVTSLTSLGDGMLYPKTWYAKLIITFEQLFMLLLTINTAEHHLF